MEDRTHNIAWGIGVFVCVALFAFWYWGEHTPWTETLIAQTFSWRRTKPVEVYQADFFHNTTVPANAYNVVQHDDEYFTQSCHFETIGKTETEYCIPIAHFTTAWDFSVNEWDDHPELAVISTGAADVSPFWGEFVDTPLDGGLPVLGAKRSLPANWVTDYLTEFKGKSSSVAHEYITRDEKEWTQLREFSGHPYTVQINHFNRVWWDTLARQ